MKIGFEFIGKGIDFWPLYILADEELVKDDEEGVDFIFELLFEFNIIFTWLKLFEDVWLLLLPLLLVFAFNFWKAFSKYSRFGGVTGVFEGAHNYKLLIKNIDLVLVNFYFLYKLTDKLLIVTKLFEELLLLFDWTNGLFVPRGNDGNGAGFCMVANENSSKNRLNAIYKYFFINFKNLIVIHIIHNLIYLILPVGRCK